MDACRGAPTSFTPIWLNRQAGRYMPEYHQLKGNTPSLDFFTNPELATQATLDAQRILGVDAAIMFADLLPILVPMGFQLDYVSGVGPVIQNPLRDTREIDGIRSIDAEVDTAYTAETITNILSALPNDVALIGFAGAPFTLASYVLEGKSSRQFSYTKRLMYGNQQAWLALLEKIVDSVADYVLLQIGSGVDAIQLFDSWVGCLSVEDYVRYVKPSTVRLMSKIKGRVPVIYFGTANTHLLDDMYDTGPDFMAVDWRAPLVETWDRLGCPAIQGNMDPIALCSNGETVCEHASRILDSVGRRPGHIFNLGHGILPETPVENVRKLVDFVHESTENGRSSSPG